jgi:SAM-dependent methyltransferase
MTLTPEKNLTMNDLRKSYDEVPYPSHAKPFSHIKMLGAIAELYGLNPASPASCRVLELGCADGGNLVPMAFEFPSSRFVGIDLSSVQVVSGRAVADDLKLTNLELREADILNLGCDDLQEYDYIIVHGVFSWVPPNVQDKILAICRDHLSDKGLAYISYNTYPGWHGKEAMRKMLRYHTRNTDNLRQKAQIALEFIAAFPTPVESPGNTASILFQQLKSDLQNIDDPATYLVHEYLVDTNWPLYFNDFITRAGAFGLRYVEDAFPGSTSPERLPPKTRKWINEIITEGLEYQQYIDLFGNISFRRSLLCRDRWIPDSNMTWDRLRKLYAHAMCKRVEPKDGVSQFRTDPGRQFSIEHPELLSVIERLVDARPMSVSLEEFREILGNSVGDDEATAMFEDLLRNAVLQFTTHPNACSREMRKHPFASDLVRYQSTSGIVTSAYHRPIRLENPFEQQLLGLLDGTHTVTELTVMLRKRLKADKPISDTEWKTLVCQHLGRLHELGLLGDRNDTSPKLQTPG